MRYSPLLWRADRRGNVHPNIATVSGSVVFSVGTHPCPANNEEFEQQKKQEKSEDTLLTDTHSDHGKGVVW